MSLKVVTLLDKLLQHTQLTAQELLSSGIDWKVNEKGIYVLCALGNHHYKIENSELTPEGHILNSCKLHRKKESLEKNVSPISTQSVNQMSNSSVMRKYSSPIRFNPPKRSNSDNIAGFTSRIAATPTLLSNKNDNIACMNKLDLNE